MVIVIMATLAGVVVVAATDSTLQVRQDATRASMTAIRDAMFAFRRDVGRLPNNMRELVDRGALVAFDPATRSGWRGPYVFAPIGVFGEPDLVLQIVPPQWSAYGGPADLAMFDAWSRPFLIQVPDEDTNGSVSAEEARHARLLSAGENGRIQTPRNVLLPFRSLCGDDEVLYLHIADLRQP